MTEIPSAGNVRGGNVRRRSRVWWFAAAVVVIAALFALYWLQARSSTVGSDGASIVLQGAAMRHGNLLLHGWVTSDVSFYSTELVLYMLLQTVVPMSAGLVPVAAAVTYTSLVVLAAALAKGRATGREGIVRACTGAGVMLAPALGIMTSTVLHGPDHTGSAVPVLVAWLVIDRCRPRWYVPAAVCLLLAWGAVADPLIEITGAAAIAVACAARSAHQWLRRRRGEALAAPAWFEPSLAIAAVASVAVASLGTAAIRAAGGFTTSPVDTSFTGIPGLWRHAAITGKGLLELFGAAFWEPGASAAQLAFDWVHLAGVVLALIGLALALRRFFRQDALLTAGLAAGIILNVAAYMTSAYATDVLSIREAAAVLPFAAVLAGRLVPGALLRTRLRALRPVPVLAAVGTAYAAMLGVNAFTVAPAAPQYSGAVQWLAGHHLTSGLGAEYWVSNIVTVESGNRVKVRATQIGPGGFSRPQGWEDDTAWYEPSSNTARFLLTDAVAGTGSWKAQLRTAERTFGPLTGIYHVDGLTVFTWHGNVLTSLRR